MMSSNDSFSIGDRKIGGESPCFVIAEVGLVHDGSLGSAHAFIDAVAHAGVDAVKFQTFRAEQHVSKYAEMPTYLEGYESIHDLIKTLELDRDWQKPLKAYAESKGVIFFSSPCDVNAVDSLEDIDVPAHKVASFDLPDLDLVRYIARTQKPILMSTGMADWMEIQRAVDICRNEGKGDGE